MIKLFITLILLSGPYCSSNTHNSHWLQRFREINIDLRIARIIKRPDFAPGLNNLDGWHTKFGVTKAWLHRQKTIGGRLVIAPPMQSGPLPLLYTGGISDVCKPLSGLSLVYVDDKNADGSSRVYNREIIIAHELGHLLGASHDPTIYPDGVSLMGAFSASTDIHPNEKFSDFSKQQIYNCLGVK